MSCIDAMKIFPAIEPDCCLNRNRFVCEGDKIVEMKIGALKINPVVDFSPFKDLGVLRLISNQIGRNLDEFIRSSQIDKLPKLRHLAIINNQLSGEVTCALPILNIIDFTNNQLTGTVPSCLIVPRLVLNLGKNSITGSIPEPSGPSTPETPVDELLQTEPSAKVITPTTPAQISTPALESSSTIISPTTVSTGSSTKSSDDTFTQQSQGSEKSTFSSDSQAQEPSIAPLAIGLSISASILILIIGFCVYRLKNKKNYQISAYDQEENSDYRSSDRSKLQSQDVFYEDIITPRSTKMTASTKYASTQILSYKNSVLSIYSEYADYPTNLDLICPDIENVPKQDLSKTIGRKLPVFDLKTNKMDYQSTVWGNNNDA